MQQQEILLTVSELTSAIKFHLEERFSSVTVQGEISNFKKQISGHAYFTLKDQGAQISCVMFRRDLASLSVMPKDGDQVDIQAELSVYPPRGAYQLVVRKLSFSGQGRLLQRLQEMKEIFLKRGWFDQDHKQLLPKYPKRIGVVTSPTGAVISDILNVLERRNSGFHLILNPVKVQGNEAAIEISQAIREFNKHNLVDVIIVGRGGGSIEDLWCFNQEAVVKSIYESKIPILSAIGHETDTTLADYAADVRAPTPSAAAEIVMQEKYNQLDFIQKMQKNIDVAWTHFIRHKKEILQRTITHPVLTSVDSFSKNHWQKIDEIQGFLERLTQKKLHQEALNIHQYKQSIYRLNPLLIIKNQQKRLEQLSHTILSLTQKQIQEKSLKVEKIGAHVGALNPKNLLTKGYTILFDEKDNCAIVSVKKLKKGQNVTFALADGEAKASISEVKE